ncbi:MAG: hypothetical protein MOGMAGMI_01828 [Candidatus Omnitrophica bacterium]|nr:hypothetical protein [Candidatus Omnitrophota bacterium]
MKKDVKKIQKGAWYEYLKNNPVFQKRIDCVRQILFTLFVILTWPIWILPYTAKRFRCFMIGHRITRANSIQYEGEYRTPVIRYVKCVDCGYYARWHNYFHLDSVRIKD